MKFSLITVTMGDRPNGLARLRASLEAQTVRDFEHIVVDHRAHPELRGCLSCARNYGMSLAKGDVIAFPDDDAWYAPDTLECAAECLQDKESDGVSFRVTDERGRCSAGGWMASGRFVISKGNVWRSVVSCSFFVRKTVADGVSFDERLGAGSGTRFGSGEETDYILHLVERGARILYDGSRTVFHPRFTGVYTGRRGWLYGNGCGFVLRHHGYGIWRLLWMAGAQFARAGQSLLLLHPRKAYFHLMMFLGRIAGYCRT